jgi:AraC-like DNA-binding protein
MEVAGSYELVIVNEIAVMRQLERLLQLAALFDSVKDALVWIKDRDGRYCWVNRAFRINYTMDRPRREAIADAEDVVGKTDYDLSPTFLAEQYRLDDEQVLTGKRIVDRIELVGQPEGLTVWNVTNKIPLTDTDGAIIGTAGITQRLDTNRKEMNPEPEFGPLLEHLRDHYREPITNQQLARLAHMSVRAFERKFRGCFHLTPQKYLRKLRLCMASRALVYTNEPLANVALNCGFVDQSHFAREFRRYFGRTPREYRAHYSLRCDVAAPGTIPAAHLQYSVSPPPISSTI